MTEKKGVENYSSGFTSVCRTAIRSVRNTVFENQESFGDRDFILFQNGPKVSILLKSGYTVEMMQIGKVCDPVAEVTQSGNINCLHVRFMDAGQEVDSIKLPYAEPKN